MAKRPFIVSPNEQPTTIPQPHALELEQDTKRLIRKFARDYGKKYPRLLAALRATEEEPNEPT